MYRLDPILSSSPPQTPSRRDPANDSSGDELAMDFNTQPTQPLSKPGGTGHFMEGTHSRHFGGAALPTQPTQPTMPWNGNGRVSMPSGAHALQTTQPTQPLSRLHDRPYRAMSPAALYQPTQPTQAVNRSTPPFDTQSRSSPQRSTQPTQLITTPQRQQKYSHIQVLRSSPHERHSSPAMSQSQGRPFLSSMMAPPGTFFQGPPRVAKPFVDLTSEDGPVESDPDEEEDLGSNIRPSDIEFRSSRIAETPQKNAFGAMVSTYSYSDSPATINGAKRTATEAFHGASSAAKRYQTAPQRQNGPARAMPVQNGPSRAVPVQTGMRVGDINDPILRMKVQRLLNVNINRSVQEVYNTLVAFRGDYNAALQHFQNAGQIRHSSPDELTSIPRKTAQRIVEAKGSIRDRYKRDTPESDASVQIVSPQVVKKKGRLVRGRKNRTPTPELESSPPKQINRAPITIESDDDEAIDVESEDDGSHSTDLLAFFNTCSVEAMVDLSNQKVEDIRSILDHRPFKSIAQIEKLHVEKLDKSGKKAGRKPKVTFGSRLVEAASEMWDGFLAVDELVKQCKDAGKPIAAAMENWGVNVFGASTEDGELALTNIDDSDASSTRDSGIGTPNAGSDNEADLIRKAGRTKTILVKKPANMNAEMELKDYQVVGLNWLNLLYQNGVSGILADDMGLGKTCQVIAFLSHLKEQQMPGPHLIIVPGSTLENWLREFQHFSKKMRVEPYYGAQASRFEQQEHILDNVSKGHVDVIVTTYDLAFKPADNSFLRKCRPKACIFDEGHVLRNSNTQRYKSLMKIKADFRLLLTGTPLQNSLRELVSILAFIMPEIFADMSDKLEIVFKMKAKVTDADTHDALLSTQRIHRARSMMTPFVLRRKKAQVLKHLPKKTCRVEWCGLTETQKKLYAEQLDRQKQVLRDRAAGIVVKDHANIMMKLRQAAIHPLLFRDRYTDDIIRKMSKACRKEDTFAQSDPATVFEELQLYQDYQSHSLCIKYPKALGKYALKNEEWMDSGKVQKLAELLKKHKENGDRTLIFSQFTSVMDILQWVLDTLDISYCRIDGSTPISDRQTLIDTYYEDTSIDVFMLSTKSGGAGINLACANKVIIFDSSFNPQDDIQAENRAHRVGQTRDVEVVRLVTKATVEEQIHALGVSKLELDKMVAGEEGEGGKKKKDEVSAADAAGIEAVERMLMEEIEAEGKEKEKEKEGDDVKGKFLDGLKKAGLDMSAA
ncbi:SNF2 family N-terminal domain-containing protein [Dendryphion nanum]|uniref:DNA helicase n=1 Tax=Dendryphion nanum TaxID=256645 RepID=A0A9P9DQT8_9PLEO|nr:SNF2 family N-terminal domain-containing protein [Dendryphion nanum]